LILLILLIFIDSGVLLNLLIFCDGILPISPPFADCADVADFVEPVLPILMIDLLVFKQVMKLLINPVFSLMIIVPVIVIIRSILMISTWVA
jgi:hypothetical protein